MKNIYDDSGNNNEPDYENNLAFPPQEIKSQDELNEAGGRQSDVLLTALKRCNELKKENDILWESLTASGLIKCPKCGYFHKRNFICWYCGYDEFSDKELDKCLA